MSAVDPLDLPAEGPRRGRPPKSLSLPDLATRINATAADIEDRRAEFCALIAEAQDRVARETNLTFASWAYDNLRKPTGEPWALSYLYKLAMFGREPNKLREHRAAVARHGQTARRALSEIERAHKIRLDSVAEEVSFLMAAWEKASDEARRQFLKIVSGSRR